MVWQYLHPDIRQRREIDELQLAVAAGGDNLEDLSKLRQVVASANQRIGQLELALEALMRVLEVRAGVSRDELTLMLQRIDLADGVEDGQMGPDRSAEAPPCPSCGRPVNPKRNTCLFCNAAVSAVVQQQAAPPPRLVTCVRCQAQVPERDSFFSEDGIVCPQCFS